MTAKDYRLRAREALRGKWKHMCLLMLVISMFSYRFGLDLAYEGWFSAERTLWGYTYHVPLGFGWVLAAVLLGLRLMNYVIGVGRYAAARSVLYGQTPSLRMLFPMKLAWKALLMNIVSTTLIILQSLLLVVPGLIAMYRYIMTDYILMENPDMGPIQALKESRRRMKGRKWELFCVQLSFIGWMLLGSAPSLAVNFLLDLPAMSTAMLTRVLNLLFATWVTVYMELARAAFFHDIVHGKKRG